MTTALDIIKGALRKIGQYAPGETIAAADSTDALDQLNAMLDLWSTEHLAIYNNVETVFNFTSGKGSYTVGTGGDINIARPLKITGGYTRITNANSNVDYPCTEIAFDQYAAIGLKNQPGPWPKAMYYNTNYPLAQLVFWPVPSSGYEFHLWTDMVFSQFSGLTSTVSMPQGYILALETNLACLIAPEYGVQPSPELKEQARSFKRLIKDLNQTPQNPSTYDGAIAGRPANDAGWILHGGFN
jgi:hypothetical protein